MHRRGKQETRGEAVFDKLKLYLPSQPEDKYLEEEKLAMVDGDKDATENSYQNRSYYTASFPRSINVARKP